MSGQIKAELKRAILAAGRQMQAEDLTVGTWGNISVRDPESGLIYLTPSGMRYDRIGEDDIVVLAPDGSVFEGIRKPSIERMMHVCIYRERSDVHAVLHTHPVESMVFAVLHRDLPVITDEMAQAIGGPVKVTQYALPGSMELAEQVAAALKDVQACLIANHGAVCVGKNLDECFKVAKVLETSAAICAKALRIGEPVEISEADTRRMRDFALYRYGQTEAQDE